MRSTLTHAVIALALCTVIVHAQESQQTTFDTSSQQQQQPEEAWQTTPDDYPFKPSEPTPVTPDEVEQAKSSLQQLMAKLNVKHVEPLFNTMDGYCSAFKGLCTASCAERIKLSKTQDRRDVEIAVEDASDQMSGEVKGCVDPQAQTVASAGALCQCVGYDMTDRINFAVVGGIVTSEPPSSSSSDFSAQGILDGMTNLPAVPTFLSIIHVLQNVCFYIGFLDVLATNPHPASCPATTPSAISALLPVLGPILGGLIPGLGGNGSASSGGGGSNPNIGDILGGIFGGGGGSGGPHGGGGGEGGDGGGGEKLDSGVDGLLGSIIGGTNGNGSGNHGGGIGGLGDIIGSIISGNKPPIPEPEPVAPAPPTNSHSGGPLAIPTPSPKPREKLFGLFSEEYTPEASGSDKREVERPGFDRLVSHDGRVAKIVRTKKRGAKRRVKERQDFV
ncbi:hypothetical protein MVEG_07937 [Podila verticillata NRRL 6337]|nr:hypothetical protein MVEG_07937 [Podila verticillata NRRL 6337]